MEGRDIKERIAPRSAVDVAVGVAVGAVQSIPVLGCAAGVLAATRSAEAALVTLCVLFLVWLAFMVRRLRVGAQGIEFVRSLGKPKQVSWKDVVSVERASRSELIVRGWLWPLFPAREMTASLTSEGHYRIRTTHGDAYYPPADPEEFERLIAHYRGASGVDGAA